jgi:hypothetical protein
VIWLYAQRCQLDIRNRVTVLGADLKFLTGILDSIADELIIGEVGEVGQTLIGFVNGWRNRK